MPAPSSVHIDAALTGYVQRSGQFGLVAEQIAPAFPVKFASDKYYIFGDEHLRHGDVQARAARARSGEGRWSTSTGTYAAREYPFKTPVEQDTIDNADPQIDPMAQAAAYVKSVVNLAWEARLQVAATTSANFGTVNAAGASWTALNTTTIESDIDTAKEGIEVKSGFAATHIVIPAATARGMKRVTAIRELVKYTDPTLLVNGDLPPTLFGLKVVIPGARANSANEGQTASIARLWPASGGVQVLYVDPTAGNQERMTWASTFRWTGFGAGGEGVRTWFVDDGRFWYVEYATYQDEKVVATSCGARITGTA